MVSTVMARPVRTTDGAAKAPIASPPDSEPHAMPTLAADAGRADASAPPGPARLTARNWSEGTMPKENTPQAARTSATSGAIGSTR
ncbi:hypothetical protein LUX39_34510 [Actinomadura madurae]|nr:hypothetical protein [Actinomadura madurae]MCQ0018273.1 hypothetical protein [Actinomadura madurae]